MLPSQQQAPVYVGPHGAIARLGRDVRRDVDGRDVDAASSDDEDKKPPNWMKARRQMLAQKAAADADERDTIAAKAVARMRAAARDAAQGGSATRDADQGVSAVGSRLEAVSLSSCSLTEAIDEEMQRQCLSALTVNARYTEDIISALAAAGSAACVCRGWRNFLRDETAWAQLAAGLRVPSAGLSWRTGALRAHAERVALRRRWHNGVCADFCARAVHNRLRDGNASPSWYTAHCSCRQDGRPHVHSGDEAAGGAFHGSWRWRGRRWQQRCAALRAP